MLRQVTCTTFQNLRLRRRIPVMDRCCPTSIAIAFSVSRCRYVSSSLKLETNEPLFSLEPPTQHPFTILDQLRKHHIERNEENKVLCPPNREDTRHIVTTMARYMPLHSIITLTNTIQTLNEKHLKAPAQAVIKYPIHTPDWVKLNLQTLIQKRNKCNRRFLEPPAIPTNQYQLCIEVLMDARELSVRQPLLWSRTRRNKLRRTVAMRDKKRSIVDDNGDINDINTDTESPVWSQQRLCIQPLHAAKSDEIKRWEAQQLALHIIHHLPERLFRGIIQQLDSCAPPTETRRMHCLGPRIQECAPLSQSNIQRELATFFYVNLPENTSITNHENTRNNNPTPFAFAGDSVVTLTDIELELLTNIVMTCRESTVTHGLTWDFPEPTAHHVEAERESRDQAQHQARTIHAAKEESTKRTEAMEMVQHLSSNVNMEEFQQLMQFLERYSNAILSDATKQELQRVIPATTAKASTSMRFLSAHLSMATSTHLHLVAKEIASFFYLEVDDTFISRHQPLKEAKKGYDAAVENLFEALCIYQEKWYAFDAQTHIEEYEVDPHPQYTAPRLRTYHVIMDAISTTQDTRVVPGRDRMVFVDNVPIDMTSMELNTLYSRCGPVESIQLFNQRPDLDPGRLSLSAVALNKRNHRNNAHFQKSKYYERARTPVYALITFASEEGYTACIDPNLRLFGMIIERHDVRSYQATGMTKLFIDDIPPSWSARDLEQEMTRCLDPMLTVYLDLGANSQRYGTSCEIHFPSFDVTYLSYQKLLQEMNLSRDAEITSPSPSINFFRTPRDATKYWTRELGFF